MPHDRVREILEKRKKKKMREGHEKTFGRERLLDAARKSQKQQLEGKMDMKGLERRLNRLYPYG